MKPVPQTMPRKTEPKSQSPPEGRWYHSTPWRIRRIALKTATCIPCPPGKLYAKFMRPEGEANNGHEPTRNRRRFGLGGNRSHLHRQTEQSRTSIHAFSSLKLRSFSIRRWSWFASPWEPRRSSSGYWESLVSRLRFCREAGMANIEQTATKLVLRAGSTALTKMLAKRPCNKRCCYGPRSQSRFPSRISTTSQ